MSVCSIFLTIFTILTFHQTILWNNHQPLSIQLGSEDLQVDHSISDVFDNNHQRKTWKGTEILNELKGKGRVYLFFPRKKS